MWWKQKYYRYYDDDEHVLDDHDVYDYENDVVVMDDDVMNDHGMYEHDHDGDDDCVLYDHDQCDGHEHGPVMQWCCQKWCLL